MSVRYVRPLTEQQRTLLQYCGQFCLRGSRTGPPILWVCYPIQPRGEELHAPVTECTAYFAPPQETATKVCCASVATAAYAPGACHVSHSEPLQLVS